MDKFTDEFVTKIKKYTSKNNTEDFDKLLELLKKMTSNKTQWTIK